MIEKVSIPTTLSEDADDYLGLLLKGQELSSSEFNKVGDVKTGDVFLKANSKDSFGVITLSHGNGLEVIQKPVSICCGIESPDERRVREIQDRLSRINNENMDDKMVDFIEEGLEHFYSQDLSEGFSIAMGRDPHEKLSRLDKIMVQSLCEKAMYRFLQNLKERRDEMD